MTRRRLLLLVAAYLVLATTATVTSRVLDRQKLPNGLTRTFYEGSASTGVVRFQELSPEIDLGFVEADPSLPRRSFAVRWEGIWYRHSSDWVELYAGADDAVKVELDDQIVLDRNGARGTGARRATVHLPAGPHRLVVTYEQGGGNYWFYFWAGKFGTAPQTIDAESLFPSRPAERRVHANQNLLLLRRAAALLWVVPPVFAFLWTLPWSRGGRSLRSRLTLWLNRNEDRLRRAQSRRRVILAALYLVLATATFVTSRVLDARQKLPIGLTRTIYEGGVSTGVARSQQLSTELDLAFLDTDPTLPRRFFGVRWEGIWYRTRGEWIDMYVDADGAVRVELDDKLVLEHGGAPGTSERPARFLLPAGAHRFVVSYEQGGDDSWLQFRVGRAGTPPGTIDAESLFPTRPAARRVRANHNLFLLRSAATLLWVLPPLVALLWSFMPGPATIGGHLVSWLRRNQDNLRRAFSSRSPVPSAPPGERSVAPVDRAARSFSRRIAALYIVVVVVFLGSIWRFHDRETGFTSLIAFGRQFDAQAMPALRALPHAVSENSGYDGQFYAQLALDPLLRTQDLRVALDSIEIRSRRILLPWTAYLLGLGRPGWVIEAYAIQNVGFWLLLGWVLLRWLPPVNIRNWLAWCGCLLSVGSVMSVQLALTDLPSASIMALGLAVAESGRPLAGGLLGLSGLARETNLIAILGIDWLAQWRTRGVRAALTLLLVVLPLALWMGYLHLILGPRVWPVSQGGTFVLPFGGVLVFLQRAIQDVQWSGWHTSMVRGLVALISVGTQGLYLLWRAEWHRPWWRVGIAYAAFFAIFPYAVLEGNPGAFVRVLLPLSLAFNVLIPQSRWFWPLFVVGNATVFQGLESLSLLPW